MIVRDCEEMKREERRKDSTYLDMEYEQSIPYNKR
ncbi:predicted protein [Botrytis cinerea T4]|uniref:Uncharacterized protein n=1 Tax=Botryotinia fuckeliana (strain T4) TaxID=999810 RepID=G2YMU1_BOTF4|nr:predicted protein [Botrytis cinerea T4]